MANLEMTHDILVAGSDLATCLKRIHHFFDTTMLIRYDEVQILENESVNGTDADFRARMEQGIKANRQAVKELVTSLQDEGFTDLNELQSVEKGYISKIFHTIAHLMDGFIGIDSQFYNLEEDSHGISRDLRQKILAAPGEYWVLRVKGRITSASEDSLDALRTFEWKGGKK
jgi:hypothetical protein